MRILTGQIEPLWEGEGVGSTPPPANTPPASGTSEHPVAPWGNEGVWNVGEGDKAAPWWNTLSDEAARKHVEAKKYANPNELALANYNLTRLQTGDPAVVALPGTDASPEAWKEFNRKIGVPDTQDGYNDALQFEGDVKVDPGMMEFGKKAFHEAGLTPTQARKVAEAWNTFAAEQNAQFLAQDKESNDKALDELQMRWGSELEQNREAGNRVVKALGLSNDLIERVEQNIGSAAIVELLATIGRKSDEGTFTSGGTGDPNDPSSMSKDAAQAKIAELNGDTDFQKKYTDKNHPGHKEAVQLMERLFART